MESLPYRARKWLIQKLSTLTAKSNQHQWLEEVDWDIVVIFDACRFDTFDAVVNWPVKPVTSPGTSTIQWLRAAADSGIFTDCHVVAGTPQYESVQVGADKVDTLWEDHWNDELETVLPEPVLDRMNDIINGSNKRIVGHIQPPHWPYVVRVGDKWLPTFPNVDLWHGERGPDVGNRMSLQEAMERGIIDPSTAADAYESSVASTWDVVQNYVGQWVSDGQTVVVTADHGEAFGRLRDFGLYGHPVYCHIPPLTRVPFAIFEPASEPTTTVDSVDDRLKALGYAE